VSGEWSGGIGLSGVRSLPVVAAGLGAVVLLLVLVLRRFGHTPAPAGRAGSPVGACQD
jgi:hypothetical protein